MARIVGGMTMANSGLNGIEKMGNNMAGNMGGIRIANSTMKKIGTMVSELNKKI